MNNVNDTTTKGIQCKITTIRLERSCDDLWIKNISHLINLVFTL
jgi:hypothetical protein